MTVLSAKLLVLQAPRVANASVTCHSECSGHRSYFCRKQLTEVLVELTDRVGISAEQRQVP
jgi:hypothetical protein